jgi:polyhydroxyalkanoate synthesis repressor PhaR
LYDTWDRRYVRLADIRRLVLDRVEWVVLDKKTRKDITRPVLLQVIAGQEGTGESLLSRDFLAQVICFHGSGMQGVIGSYLEQMMKLFVSEQHKPGEHAQAKGDESLMEATLAVHKNRQRWRLLQDEIYHMLMTR